MDRSDAADAVVLGAGFGGLGAALAMAERGLRPVVVEALTVPGGCAQTFRRGGARFDAGATLCSGFGPGQLFRRWIDRHALDVPTEPLDPVVEIRTPSLRLAVPDERPRLVATLCEFPGAPTERLRVFFAEQARVADTMWRLLDDPELLPPLSPSVVVRHVLSAPRFAAVARLAGRTLLDALRRHRLEDFAPLRAYLESFAQITVQCGVAEAEAPVALATADYPFRGTRHVPGGVGVLADGLVTAIRRTGGEVRFATRATAIRRERGTWTVRTNRGDLRAPVVVANVLPQSLARLADDDAPALRGLAADVADGWGAAMLYRVVRAPRDAAPGAAHLDLTVAPDLPYTDGRHVFASVSSAAEPGRAPEGFRAMTVSTHMRIADLRRLSDDDRAARVREVQDRMRATLAALAPEWSDVASELPASPRTFERFTFRPEGLVGGVPRRAGLRNYRGLAPVEVRPGLWLAGDSVFPGQSTLAAATGGTRVAEAVLRSGRACAAESAR